MSENEEKEQREMKVKFLKWLFDHSEETIVVDKDWNVGSVKSSTLNPEEVYDSIMGEKEE